MGKYELKEGRTALGIEHKFVGPGLTDYDSAHLMQPMNDWANKCCEDEAKEGGGRNHHEAEAVARMLGKAYEAGFAAAKRELRGWLETPKRKWGDDF